MQTLRITCPNCLATNRMPTAKLSEGGRCGKCKNALFSARPIELTAGNFRQYLNNTEIPIVVDFWASWCAPCQVFAPVFAQSAKVLEPQVRLAKLDTGAHPQLAAQFDVRSIPTLVMLNNGREVARQMGAMDGPRFQAWVKSQL